MRDLPSGTVTFLFTDVEGSTRLLHERGPEAYAEALADHRRAIRRASADEGGVEVDTQGDAFFIAFDAADGAVRAAAAMATGFADGPIRVRIGLHTGEPLLGEEGYVGEDVHLGARIAAAGHGGQVLMSRATRDAIGGVVDATDLGEHRLKDITAPIAIFQLGTESFPPLKTISNTNLPRPADSFVGREGELEDITSRVRAGNRLVTLVGPGGTGKTRLAIEAASSLLTDFKAGGFWVDLSPVRDPDAVATTIAATLTTERDIEAFIGEREMLLTLDNLEQVIDAAPWVASLVQACPNLAVLVTSRERLRVRGESLVEVPPLAGAESGQLFADRSGLERTADIDELCARLEHLPLALELAAARTASLAPRQILDRLGQRLDLLKGGRDADPRQQTLRATIDWSYGLLSLEEQRLLCCLAVFAGGTTLEGVEAVCDGDLDTLESLIDKSLVRTDGERYTMLETVREYAAEQLASSGDADAQRSRHAAFFQELMAARIPELAGGGADGLGRALTAEVGNVQAAFAWLVESGDARRVTELVETVWWFLHEFLSVNRIGLSMCEAALAMPSLGDADRALLRHREGNFAIGLADPARARQAWLDTVELAHRIGDAERESHGLHNLALLSTDPDESVEMFERATALKPPKDEREAHKAQWNLSGLKRRAGDTETADRILADVLAWAERVNDHQYIGAAEREIGERDLQRGDASVALERATRSRDLGVTRSHTLMALLAENLRARALARLGRPVEAVRSLGEALEMFREGDLEADSEIISDVLLAATEVLTAAGDPELARACEAVRSRVNEGWPRLPDVERNHDDWLQANGVQIAPDPTDVDASQIMDRIRRWLGSQQASGLDSGTP